MSEKVLASLGKIITDPQEKDAVHIAVLPVVAGERLCAGQHVGLGDDWAAFGTIGAFGVSVYIGIVDPYLDKARPVNQGEWFWLFLYPGSITSLRHEWTHPALEANDDKTVAKEWITQFGAIFDRTFDAVMSAAGNVENGEEYWEFSENRYETDIPNHDRETFWKHYETITGRRPKNKDQSIFWCAC